MNTFNEFHKLYLEADKLLNYWSDNLNIMNKCIRDLVDCSVQYKNSSEETKLNINNLIKNAMKEKIKAERNKIEMKELIYYSDNPLFKYR